MQILLILALLFAILVSVFAIQNTAVVPVRLFIWTLDAVSVSVLILASAATGAVAAFLLGVGRMIRSAIEERRHKRTVADYETRVADLQRRLDEKDGELRAVRAAPTGTRTVPGAPTEPMARPASPESRPAGDAPSPPKP